MSDFNQRAQRFNKRILKDKEAMTWWENNKDTVHDDSFMPEYPVNENLGVLETTNLYEMLRKRDSKLNHFSLQKNETLYKLVMDLYWGGIDKFNSKQIKLIEYYWIENLPIPTICSKLDIKLSTFYKYLKAISRLVDFNKLN